MKYLVETALLTHGLNSISNEELYYTWEDKSNKLVWIEKGQIKIGTLEEYLKIRNNTYNIFRADSSNLDYAVEHKLNAALTASATMRVCQMLNIPFAVTGGMGGIGDIKGEKICPDLGEIIKSTTTLVATSPKDMLDINASIKYLLDSNVSVYGKNTDVCTGFMLKLDPVKITGIFNKSNFRVPCLLLNEISKDDRFSDSSILENMIAKGKEAESKGGMYHPAANEALDRLTGGASSRLQLKSLLNNIAWAKALI